MLKAALQNEKELVTFMSAEHARETILGFTSDEEFVRRLHLHKEHINTSKTKRRYTDSQYYRELSDAARVNFMLNTGGAARELQIIQEE